MARQYLSGTGTYVNNTANRQYVSGTGTAFSSLGGAVGNPAATISWTEDNDVNSATASASAPGSGTITTTPFQNNTGTILASLTGLTVTILSLSNLAFVKNFTNATTNTSGVMSLSDSTLVAGTWYAVVTTNASGVLGVEKYQAA